MNMTIDPSALDSNEVELAKEAQRCIIAALDHSKAMNITIAEDDDVERLGDSPVLRLPPKILRMFADILGEVAQGKTVTILPREMYISTQEAAVILNVSRPYLIKLLEEERIPHHKVGRHRRVLLKDVLAYKEDRHKTSQDALDKLAEQAQELGMGY
ncbi:helix-turn-helix domain-containing protein [Undibacterium sp. TC9W]|uniref:helix-turn-helix domain-containing protein n=1 Tax=Undibacterium sp. TC9W TaxID=3413053 RepID=UPI003BEFDA20